VHTITGRENTGAFAYSLKKVYYDKGMLTMSFVLSAIIILCASGFPGAFMSPRSRISQYITTGLMLCGGTLGLYGLLFARTTATSTAHLPWFLPWGEFSVSIDSLGSIFTGLVFILPALSSLYGIGYWNQSHNTDTGRRLGIFQGLLAGSMALITIAHDGFLFLIAWEIMALSAYFASTVQSQDPEVRHAGWIYLIATHIGTLCLIAMFALWKSATGSFALVPVTNLPIGTTGTLFVLMLIGFGCKAGLMPLHFWLPGSHANAPSHVSAVMSGVMLKMGIYGIVRMTSLFELSSAWWGGTVLVLGSITGIGGIIFALRQHDIKKLLAYSSIENIGIITMGLGLALLGRSMHRIDLVFLGLGGALLHVVNHGLFKPLMFFCAGSIIHTTHTRDIEQLGGLAKRMPRLLILFVIGAIAICGLPPLNGFISEWLLYTGFFYVSDYTSGLALMACGTVVLAIIGSLAVACFVKVTSTVFLGTNRSIKCDKARDPSASMMVPMIMLAAGCLLIGIFPSITISFLTQAVTCWTTLPHAASVPALETVSFRYIRTVAITGIGLFALVYFGIKIISSRTAIAQRGTWDCGYARPTSRMQYTGASFVQTLVELFAFRRYKQLQESSKEATLFPKKSIFKRMTAYGIITRSEWLLSKIINRILPAIRLAQQGQTHLYILYLLVITIILFIIFWVGALL
jgi:hydrogenase-4 component B